MLEKSAHDGIVAKNRRRVDATAGDFRMRRENRLGVLQRAVPGSSLDERGLRIAYAGYMASSSWGLLAVESQARPKADEQCPTDARK
jgi:hypothetical protein